MLLRRFEVSRFRNVLDSSEIPVEPDVTCLVGKNESGKTALLHALQRLHPARPATFELDADYPRWLLIRDRKEGVAESAIPIRASFEMEQSDATAIEDRVGSGVLKDQTIHVSRGYEGPLRIDIEPDEAKAVTNLVKSAGAGAGTKKLLTLDSFDALKESIASARESVDLTEKTGEELAAVEEAIGKLLGDKTFEQTMVNLIARRLPKFFYFGEYSTLPGRIDLRQIEGEDPPASTGLQTAWALLQLAGTDTSRLGEEDYELRMAELEAVSIDLTRQVFEYWTQNTELSVTIDVDKVTENAAGTDGRGAVSRHSRPRPASRLHRQLRAAVVGFSVVLLVPRGVQ